MKTLILVLLPFSLLSQSIVQTRAFPAQYIINGERCGSEAVRLHLEQYDQERACKFYRGMKITHIGATLAATGACLVIGGGMFAKRQGTPVWGIGAFCAFGGAVALWVKGSEVKRKAIRVRLNTSN